jgi:hypothetical protein
MWHLLQSHPAVCQEPDGIVRIDGPRPVAVLPGSFNPLHHGHTRLAAAATARLGVPVAFELSVANVDKPELSAHEVTRRVGQFVGQASVWVTRAATFAAKADLFPGAVFVLGYDTAVRLLDPRYYKDDPLWRDEVLRSLLARGSRVVVGGRLDADSVFRTWVDTSLPDDLSGLFIPLLEADFRVDVSSTLLRAKSAPSPGPG